MNWKMPQVFVVCLALGALGWNAGRASATAQAELNPSAEVQDDASSIQVERTFEAEASALQDGSCGDGRCNPPEDCNSCPADCGSCCGNYRCEPPEDRDSCPSDCS